MFELRKVGIIPEKLLLLSINKSFTIALFKNKIAKNSCKNANYVMKNGIYLPSGNNLKKIYKIHL